MLMLCGGCGALIAKDAPLLAITLPNVRREKIRGECCAGWAPPDLPERIEPASAIQPTMKSMRKTALGFVRDRLPENDWTARILGERE